MKVFISYAHDDRARMLVIAEAVRAAGHQVDVDEGILRGGDDFARRIESSIDACEACVVLWSPASAGGKPWVPAEANLALQKGKRVVSVKLAECSIPLPFSTYHMLDLTRSSDLAPLLRSLAPLESAPAAAASAGVEGQGPSIWRPGWRPSPPISVRPAGTPVPAQRPPTRWPLRLAVTGVLIAVLSIGGWLAIPALRKPEPPAPLGVPDAGPAILTLSVAPAPAATPDAGQAPVAKPKRSPADPCVALAKAYENKQMYCLEPCSLDYYPMRQDLERCRTCDQAHTLLKRCRGEAR